jgi:formylglycine-generating enzyme required for sulfatase activity
MRKLLLLSLVIVGFAFNAFAQTSPLKMVNFHKLPNEIVDLKALKDEASRDCDYDGNKAALIRVKAQGFSEKTMLDFNTFPRPGIEIIHKKYKDGEIWLYVSSGCQGTIVIKYMGEFEFKLSSKLDAKGVYELVLGMETATLVISTVPPEAEIYVDGNKVGTGYGSAAISVGSEHRYKVVCIDYLPEEDVVKSVKAEKIEKQIELRPNFGYITIKSEPSGAEVIVDGKKVGVTPYMLEKITFGQHRVELTKTGYEKHVELVIIKTGELENTQLAKVVLVKDPNYKDQEVVVTPVTPTTQSVSSSQSSHGSSTTSSNGNRTFTVNGVSFEMIAVKSGTFTMGATSEQGSDADSDERPTHSVALSDYYIGKYEVTVAQFREFINETNYRTDADKDGGSYIWNGSSWEKRNGVNWKCDASGKMRGSWEDNHPVIHVSWNDAKAYCEWLSRKTGQSFRLPTEAEWEYAARGGNKSRGYKYSGGSNINDVAWYTSTTNDSGTKPVGTKSPNELGIYDMSGNVWEWCQDWYGDYSSGSQYNPSGPSSGSYRVLRGGSWSHDAKYCRVSDRSYSTPDLRSRYLGFRVVLH